MCVFKKFIILIYYYINLTIIFDLTSMSSPLCCYHVYIFCIYVVSSWALLFLNKNLVLSCLSSINSGFPSDVLVDLSTAKHFIDIEKYLLS